MSAPQRIVIVGAGGQARDTAWLVREMAAAGASVECVGFVVSDTSRLSSRDSEVLGDFGWLEGHAERVDALALGIGTPALRLSLGAELSRAFPRLEWPVLVHPRAVFEHDSASLGRGAMIAAGVHGSVNVELEDFALVNIGVTLGHEATIGAGSVVNHGASISGGVKLGPGVLVGTGARVLQYLEVGARATVGAGAVVTRSVAPGTTVVGIPARERAAQPSS
jgi:sugar O-acyltransferase (sialic acid O-acetyltransferase NeuD family)